MDAFKPQDGITGTNNSDMDVGEINLADMNPEDIRVINHYSTLRNLVIIANIITNLVQTLAEAVHPVS